MNQKYFFFFFETQCVQQQVLDFNKNLMKFSPQHYSVKLPVLEVEAKDGYFINSLNSNAGTCT